MQTGQRDKKKKKKTSVTPTEVSGTDCLGG
jgi:hypothetical protein